MRRRKKTLPPAERIGRRLTRRAVVVEAAVAWAAAYDEHDEPAYQEAEERLLHAVNAYTHEREVHP